MAIFTTKILRNKLLAINCCTCDLSQLTHFTASIFCVLQILYFQIETITSAVLCNCLNANMFSLGHCQCSRSISFRRILYLRTYATPTSPHALLYLEHQNGILESSSLSALTAAEQLGGSVTGLIVGSPGEIEPIVENAKK